MHNIPDHLQSIKEQLPKDVTLVAVSKTKPVSDLMVAYDAGQRHFGENKVQELLEKHKELPKDIQWHFIGHLQSKKAKQIVPFVHLVHGVDSLKLAREIDKRAKNSERTVKILLQVKIAEEDTKFGIPLSELESIAKEVKENCSNVTICGLMGMATNTADYDQVMREFNTLSDLFKSLNQTLFKGNSDFNTLSMGMTGDYKLALECGSNLVRVGSAIFGERNYTTT